MGFLICLTTFFFQALQIAESKGKLEFHHTKLFFFKIKELEYIHNVILMPRIFFKQNISKSSPTYMFRKKPRSSPQK